MLSPWRSRAATVAATAAIVHQPRRPHAQASGHRGRLGSAVERPIGAAPHANGRRAYLRGPAGGRPRLVEFEPRHFIWLSVTLWQLHNALPSPRFKRLSFFSPG